MKTVKALLAAALAGATMLAGAPAGAQTVGEVTVTGRLPEGARQTASGAVSYRDLDLRTKAGEEELERRIRATAKGLCEELAKDGNLASLVEPCAREATSDALTRSALVIEEARKRGTPH